jgi:hypothetical protein
MNGIIPPPIPPIPPIPPPQHINGNKQGVIFGGSGSGTAGNHQTKVFYVASKIKNATASKNTRTRIINNPLNVYGAYGGASGGSRAPPRNTF